MSKYQWMIEFTWIGLNEQHQVQQASTLAATTQELHQSLSEKNITLLKIIKKQYFYQKLNFSNEELAAFCNQLGNLLSSGISILESLTLITHHSSSRLLTLTLKKIQQSLVQGDTLIHAFTQYSHLFPASFLQMLHLGEQTGKLTDVLQQLGDFYHKQQLVQQRITQALWYPAIVMGTALVVTIILLDFVVPQLANFFSGIPSALPLITQIIIKISDLFQRWQKIGFLLFIMSILYFVYYRPNFSSVIAILFKLPLLKPIFEHSFILSFLHTLEITYCTGLPLIRAFEILEHSTNSSTWRQKITQIRLDLTEGQPLTQALINIDAFPDLMLQSIHIGEMTGRLDTFLRWLTNHYEKELNQMIDRLLSLLEPTIILLLGVFIGVILIALYLPLFKMASLI